MLMPRRTESSGRFFLIWLLLGAQSFGGGTASLALIRRSAVETHHYLTEAEFVRDWALVQIAPGVNLLALVILIGRRWGGARGVALALGGLLLPSAAATVLMTALYAQFATLPVVRAALRGILPATVGLGLVTAIQMLRPLLRTGRGEGRLSFTASVVLIAGCAAIAALWSRVPVAIVLLGAGAVFAAIRAAAPTEPASPTELAA
jgi:chromate transporter